MLTARWLDVATLSAFTRAEGYAMVVSIELRDGGSIDIAETTPGWGAFLDRAGRTLVGIPTATQWIADVARSPLGTTRVVLFERHRAPSPRRSPRLPPEID